MGYQALLFCPDEKTARTVTQVLSELDFTVVPCSEPFAAVKKLVGEHFDAVVVTCDNEQNATLLFKSARNSPNNQSSLAVAIVEGQAGVAKAFRIGANLVLTKPINVEQAKGTLRVARGLLRKGEMAKPAAAAATATAKPASLAPGAQISVPQASAATGATTRPEARLAAAATKPQNQPSKLLPERLAPAAASKTTSPEAKLDEPAQPSLSAATGETLPVGASAPESASSANVETEKIVSTATPVSSDGFSSTATSAFGTGAASAPAPAREPLPSAPTVETQPHVDAQTEGEDEKNAPHEHDSHYEAISPAPPLMFGGTVSAGTESAGGQNKKLLLAITAIALLPALAYMTWTQWMGKASGPLQSAAQPVSGGGSPPKAAAKIPSTPPAPLAATRVDSIAAQPATTSSEDETASPNGKAAPAIASKSTRSATSPASGGKPTGKSSPQTIVVKKSPNQSADNRLSITDTSAPSVAVAASALPSLVGDSGSAPPPVLQAMNVSQGVSQGLLLKRVQPIYPATALHMRLEGAVQLLATISERGNITAVKVLSGQPLLAQAAVDAVKKWKYRPYRLSGEPVEIETQITVNFKLPQ